MREDSQTVSNPNQQLLDEIAYGQHWFHAKKTRPIWAKPLRENLQVETLEGTTNAFKGDYLCRGEIGEVWPQKITQLVSKYRPEDEIDANGWQLFTPLPDNTGVMAVRIDRDFSVESTWGKLRGQAGDFLVKSWKDRHVRYPEDVWIVNQALFLATYEPDP